MTNSNQPEQASGHVAEARELLATAYQNRGREWEVTAGNVRRGDYDASISIAALIAALTAKGEGWVAELPKPNSPFWRWAEPLPDREPSKPNPEQGLYRKFDVRRTDGSDAPGGKHAGCDYFVLDVTHDPHAKAALTAYADSVEATHPDLATEMRERYELTPPTEGDKSAGKVDDFGAMSDLLARWERLAVVDPSPNDAATARRESKRECLAELKAAHAATEGAATAGDSVLDAFRKMLPQSEDDLRKARATTQQGREQSCRKEGE